MGLLSVTEARNVVLHVCNLILLLLVSLHLCRCAVRASARTKTKSRLKADLVLVELGFGLDELIVVTRVIFELRAGAG